MADDGQRATPDVHPPWNVSLPWMTTNPARGAVIDSGAPETVGVVVSEIGPWFVPATRDRGQAGGVRRTSWRLWSTINEPSGSTARTQASTK